MILSAAGYKFMCKISKLFFAVVLAVLFGIHSAAAQTPRAEVAITLDESFFDALLDGIYQSAEPPEFPLASTKDVRGKKKPMTNSFAASGPCSDSIKLVRESGGVRTSVRFRDGKILLPLAFTGSYNPPLIGCVPFSGYAESTLDLEFDESGQRLIARVRVLNVVLSGTGGVGSSVVAKLVQGSIDRKINPLEVVRLDKMSFVVPVQNGGQMRVRAGSIRTEIANSAIIIYIRYEFFKL